MTRQESYALATILTLLLLGIVVKYIQKNTFLFDTNIYHEADSLFAVATQNMNKNLDLQDSLTKVLSNQSTPNTQIHADSTISLEQVLFATGKININTATQQELETLPRIGPAIAQRIIEHRKTLGPFKNPKDITQVKGIGPKTLTTLLPHITTTPTRNEKQETRNQPQKP